MLGLRKFRPQADWRNAAVGPLSFCSIQTRYGGRYLWALAKPASCATPIASPISPGFRPRKGDITIFQVLSHQGGFPDAEVSEKAWEDHDFLRRTVCDFSLQWAPGSRCDYHPESAHWVLAVVIEAITRYDYRETVRKLVIEPIGLSDDLFVGVPDPQHDRIASLYERDEAGCQRLRLRENNAAFWRAG
jgi:CubicO group peptidase (beta-lactamase class C family)